ncbi:MAG: hypothetical protein AB2693_35215, partial [Candidatus Thiodiazotropha sp.]
MIDLKAEKGSKEVSYVLMVDGKKVRRGSDGNLLGVEKNTTLKERQEEHEREIQQLNGALDKIKKINEIVLYVANIPDGEKAEKQDELKLCFELVSLSLRRLREIKKSKQLSLNNLKDKANKYKQMSFAYAIDLCQTLVYQIDNCISILLEVQWDICKFGAHING